MYLFAYRLQWLAVPAIFLSVSVPVSLGGKQQTTSPPENINKASAPSSAPPAATSAQSGLETPWDARKIVNKVVENSGQLKPLIAAMNPQVWVQRGAPGAYILQWQTCQRQLQDVEIVANQLLQKVDSLSKALDLYFRLEALELTTRSIGEASQNYGDRKLSSEVMQLAGRSFDSRQRLRDYLTDLAESTEANFKIADEEAQRCRGMISREPAPSTARKSKHP